VVAAFFGILAYWGLVRGRKLALKAIPIAVASIVTILGALTFVPSNWLGSIFPAQQQLMETHGVVAGRPAAAVDGQKNNISNLQLGIQ
jgi:hypothetical protein